MTQHTEVRTNEGRSPIDRLMAHLRAFYVCENELSYLHELIDCAEDAEDALKAIRAAEDLLGQALILDVRSRLQEVDPTLADA
jgi:hypothetical protein